MKQLYNKKELRIFSIALTIILCLFANKFYKTQDILISVTFLLLAISILTMGMVAPRLLAPVHKIFSSIFKIVLSIVTTVALSIVFYCVFTPISVILRTTKKDILDLKIDKNKTSYWIKRQERSITKDDLEKQF